MNSGAERSAYWNRVAPQKTFSHPLDLELLRARVQPDAAIFDYGCGYGRLGSQLQQAGFRRVVGVDPAPAMIARGRELSPALDLRLAPEPCYAHLRDPFEAILLFSVLTCIPDDEELDSLVQGLTQLPVPGGLLYVVATRRPPGSSEDVPSPARWPASRRPTGSRSRRRPRSHSG